MYVGIFGTASAKILKDASTVLILQYLLFHVTNKCSLFFIVRFTKSMEYSLVTSFQKHQLFFSIRKGVNFFFVDSNYFPPS